MDNSKRSEAARGDSSQFPVDAPRAKKVRLRDREDPHTLQPQPMSYRAAVTGAHPSEDDAEIEWPEESIPEVEEGDIIRVPGIYGKALELSSTFKNRLDKNWEHAVIVKLLVRQIGYRLLHNRLKLLWNLSGPFKIIDLENDFFLVNLVEMTDCETALTKGPWVLFDHALAVQPWTPQFRPATGKVSTAVVWVRFPDLPMSRYHPAILQAMGNLVGTTVKIDSTTQKQQRGKFARVAVEIDLTEPLVSRIELDGEEIKVAFEGLPQICFTCGRVGHSAEICQNKSIPYQDPPVNGDSNGKAIGDTQHLSNSGETLPTAYGPWVQGRRTHPEVSQVASHGSRFLSLPEEDIPSDFNAPTGDLDSATITNPEQLGRRNLGTTGRQARDRTVSSKLPKPSKPGTVNRGKELLQTEGSRVPMNGTDKATDVSVRQSGTMHATTSTLPKTQAHQAVLLTSHQDIRYHSSEFQLPGTEDMEYEKTAQVGVTTSNTLSPSTHPQFLTPQPEPPDLTTAPDRTGDMDMVTESQIEPQDQDFHMEPVGEYELQDRADHA
ncbi:hypothetical protein K2173_008291 [Erythroxylum novogranatense]|uniref:CCHC-type domain-containing protein n=1 Tax=Erythroxylum novogranatense TaxID=1862640 RepID=A0AAV8U673_9ROSI|nr:hypothetical protein K2173_008291 [Erythroxylum novogranatense]